MSSLNDKYEVKIKDNITIIKNNEKCFDEPLTEIQKDNLLKFEEEFSCRYTDEDKCYVATIKLGSLNPPLVPSYRPFCNRRRDDRKNDRRDDRRNDRRDDCRRGEKRSWPDQNSYKHSKRF